MFGGTVQPTRRGLRSRPGMIGSNVVGNHVEEDLDSLLVSGVDQLLELLQCAEVVLDSVKIDRTIAVIGLAYVVVIDDGIQPQGRDSEFLEVWEVVLNAPEVAAVVSLGSVAIVSTWGGSFGHVVAGIAVGKAVGHDQVEGVIACDALKATRRG